MTPAFRRELTVLLLELLARKNTPQNRAQVNMLSTLLDHQPPPAKKRRQTIGARLDVLREENARFEKMLLVLLLHEYKLMEVRATYKYNSMPAKTVREEALKHGLNVSATTNTLRKLLIKKNIARRVRQKAMGT